MTNREIATKLMEIANLRAIDGQIEFKVRAYQVAAETISKMSEQVATKEDIRSIAGIGPSISLSIRHIISGTQDPKTQELYVKHGELLELLRVDGIGPATARKLRKEHGCTSTHTLRELATKGLIKDSRIMKWLEKHNASKEMTWEAGNTIATMFQNLFSILSVGSCPFLVAGSLRRKCVIVHDIDFVAISPKDTMLMVKIAVETIFGDETINLGGKLMLSGDSHIAGVFNGAKIDVRIAPPESAGAMLLHLTGSKKHNIFLRKVAADKGLKLNEYGLWEGDTLITASGEQAIFEALGLEWVEPEQRDL